MKTISRNATLKRVFSNPLNKIFSYMRNGRKKAVFMVLVAALFAQQSPSYASSKDPLKVGVNIWVGWMPWWIVKEKGLLEKNHANAKLVFFGVQANSTTALASGHLDACSLATNDIVSIAAKGVGTKIVLLNDESYGADMLVTRNIDSVKDLKGKKIALEVGGVSNFFLNTVLEKNGVSPKDVQLLNMGAADAGSAFLAKTVDAAVTWEPYGSQAIKSGGKFLATSKDTPNAIVDVLAVSDETAKNRGEDVKRVLNAWFDALDYIKTHPDDAYKIMAKASDVSVKEFKEMWEGVRMYSREDNVAALGTPSKQGPYYKTVSDMNKFMLEQKLISESVTSSSVIDSSFVKGGK